MRENLKKNHKTIIESIGEYEYINSYFKGDIVNGKINLSNIVYVEVRHKYCGSVLITRQSQFSKNGSFKCSDCCQIYENSIADYIEVKLGEPLDKYWDFEKNTVNPYHIYKNSNKRIWIKCQEKDYHGSYETICSRFYNNKKCPYCTSKKIHPYDSFGYHNFDKVMSWHPDNDISPFRVSRCNGDRYKFTCNDCGNIFMKRIYNIEIRGDWCPECSMSKGEKKIAEWLKCNGVNYEYEKTYDGLVGLKYGSLSYDFYIDKFNMLIEYQGEFHEKSLKGNDHLKKQKEHDKRKLEYAKKNNIDFLEIWYRDIDNIPDVLSKTFMGVI